MTKMTFSHFGYIVESCPYNNTEYTNSATRLGCGVDENGRSQYVCVPNHERSNLVEFCYNLTTTGLYEKGNCIEVYKNGNLDQTSCLHFTNGCPDNHFFLSDLYKFPACQAVNLQKRCFFADPVCPNITTWKTSTKGTTEGLLPRFTTNHGMYNTTMDIQSTKFSEDDSALFGAIVGSLVAVAVLTVLIVLITVVVRRRKHKSIRSEMHAIDTQELDDTVDSGEDRVNDITIVPECERPLLAADEGIREIQETGVTGDPESRDDFVIEADDNENTTEPENVLMQKLGKTRNLFNPLGNYSQWKTNISDDFHTLTDDEVLVLFCFLCSDSGPPDFTDAEWLDMLNGIRQDEYCKAKSVTSEEAKQTLNRLNSHDFLWEDQDKITKDTKDETMYKIASVNRRIPFWYSSFDTASAYLRPRRYNRKPGEKCVITFFINFDDLLIRRLQMNILTHVTMEDSHIHDEIHQILNVPRNIFNDNEDTREKFILDLRNEGEIVHYRERPRDRAYVTWLWRYRDEERPDIVRSCIGLHQHWDIYIIDNKTYRKPSKYHTYPPEIRSPLYCILFAEKYQLNLYKQSHKIIRDKIRDRYFHDITEDDSEELPDEITQSLNGVIKFKSDEIRHDVMYAFVTECLLNDGDLEFFLTTASRDVISEYCRSWDYKRNQGERCLYVPGRPQEMYDIFIDKLQLDIITHCTLSDSNIHKRISKILNIPEEILKWNTNARERFVKSLRNGRVNMFRARGMTVGCAGAGKTTLLRKLQRRNNEDGNQPTETTVGLEVHEDLFEIKEGTLHDFIVNEGDIPVARFYPNNTVEERMVIKDIHFHSSRGTKLISMTDFAGQEAYYACHQVYLSRRAFYIVVIDMSKALDEEVRKYNTDRHNPEGSLFHFWKYKDYFHFWLQSIQTYCEDGKTHTNRESTKTKGSFHPVIIVASHADEVVQGSQNMFYEELENCLSDKQFLKHLISPNRYFEVECIKEMSSKQEEAIERLRKCIVETVERMPQWGEEIPLKWANLEKVLNEKKQNRERIISKQQLKEIKEADLPSDIDLDYGLRFLHEIGQIIYFSETKIQDLIIVDVQWFVDAFKYIITDEKHLARKVSKNIRINTGRIDDFELDDIWKNTGDDSFIHHKDDILPYMDRLGLMTKLQDDLRGQTYYIPSMNRTDLPAACKASINKGQKTWIMVFHFKTYLPHFFFFRLVVNCLKKWKALDMEFFCKNAAFYMVDDASHFIAIAVNKTSIQLQVFTPEKEMDLRTECVTEIRETVESLINEITQTFHRHIEYERGFSCTDIDITEEDEEYFLKESEIVGVKTSSGNGKRPCPKHVLQKPHYIDKFKMLQYWSN